MNFIYNPLENPLFVPVVIRLAYLFLFTFPLVIIFNLKDLRKTFESNIWKRYYAFFIMAPLYLIAIFGGGFYALIFLFIVMLLALNEFRKMSKLPAIYYYFSIFFALITIIVSAFFPRYFYALPVIYFIILTLVPVFLNEGKDSLKNVAYSLFVNIWINFSLAFFILTGYSENGLNMLILMGFSIVLSDVFAYAIGTLFHKIHFFDQYKIADKITPNKTFAGAIGNIIGAGIGIAITKFALPMFSLQSLIILAVLIGISGLMGGLTESMVKRSFKVKDSGTLIPGHGGILDRIDSAIRIIVIFYYYLVLFL